MRNTQFYHSAKCALDPWLSDHVGKFHIANITVNPYVDLCDFLRFRMISVIFVICIVIVMILSTYCDFYVFCDCFVIFLWFFHQLYKIFPSDMPLALQ